MNIPPHSDDTRRMRFRLSGSQPVPVPADEWSASRAADVPLYTVREVTRRHRRWTREKLIQLWEMFFPPPEDAGDMLGLPPPEPEPFAGRAVRDRAAALRRAGYPRRAARWLAVLMAAEDLQAGTADMLGRPPFDLDPLQERQPPSPTCVALAELLAIVRAEAWPELADEARHVSRGRGRAA